MKQMSTKAEIIDSASASPRRRRAKEVAYLQAMENPKLARTRELYLKYCRDNKLTLTSMRQRVLFEIVANEPIKAYDILENLSNETHVVKPPSVYRALAFLKEHKLIHRIEQIDSYMTSCHLGKLHTCMYCFCTTCKQAASVCDIPLDHWIEKIEKHHKFKVEARVIELFGICKKCQPTADGKESQGNKLDQK